ncbi:MAG TPA: copper resistance protein CopC [Acidimicrobiales bacterium]
MATIVPPRRRAGRRCLAVVAVALGALLLAPARADAHAELVSTEPAAREQLSTAPEQVVLSFTEAVELTDEAVVLYDASGDTVDTPDAEHPDGDGATVAVDLPALDEGGYVVAWRVTSSDGHPISGAFTFTFGIGEGGEEAEALLDEILTGEGGDPTLGAVYGAARFAAFAGIAVLVGATAFLLVLWPAGIADRRARRLVSVAWWVALVATAAGIGLHGAYAAGLSLGDALDPSVIGDELGTRTGRTYAVRLLVLGVGAVLAAPLTRRIRRAGTADRAPAAGPATGPVPGDVLLTAAAVGAVLLATVSAAGHAASGRLVPLALVTDVVHVGGIGVWLGGLALLAVALLRRHGHEAPADAATLGPVVARFSTVASRAVAVIVLTGVIQAWRQLGSVDALMRTTYGQLLLVKVALVVVMLGAATFSLANVRGRRQSAAVARPATVSPGPGAAVASGGTSGPDVGALRRSVGVEAAVGVVVLAVTALLVNAVPGRTAVPGGTFEAEIHGTNVFVTLSVDPTEVGPVDITVLTAEHDGTPLEPEEVTGSLALPERELGPLDVTFEPGDGTGEFVAGDVEVPFPGEWELEVVVRTSDIDQDRLATPVTIT